MVCRGHEPMPVTQVTTVLWTVWLMSLICAQVVTSCTPTPPCRSCAYVTIERDIFDCNKYYYCYHGRLWTRMRCGFNQIYSLRAQACVYQFSTTECSQSNPSVTTSSPTVTPTSLPTKPVTSSGPIINLLTSTIRSLVTGSEQGPQLGTVDQCGVKATSHIVGGASAEHGEWGWQASVRIFNPSIRRYVHFCGGALVNPNWVVTAAHCVYGTNRNNLQVVLGAYNLSMTSPDEQTRFVLQVTPHPDFKDYGNFPHDIALLQLSSPVTMSRSVSTVCIPQQGEKAEEATPSTAASTQSSGCWVTGWGQTRGTSSIYSLNEVALDLVDLDLCAARWPGYIEKTHLCAGPGDSGACKGDSGGPLVCTKSGRYFLHGVVSWGEDTCSLRGFPNVFTRVASYTDWIQQVTAEATL